MRKFILPDTDYFKSVLATEMRDYLNLLATNQRLLRNEKFVLKSLDDCLVECNETIPRLTEDVILRWQGKLSSKKSRTIAGYTSMVRQFGRYIAVLGYEVFIPELPKVHSDYIPYIFTEDEFNTIINVCDNLVMDSGTNTPVVFPALIRILYGCGLRLGEVRSLKNKDVDLTNGILKIRHAKGNKERLVPMNDSLTEICNQYYSIIHEKSTCDDYFFMHPDGRIYSQEVLIWHFNNVLHRAGIEYIKVQKRERGPCLHCLRHTFAVNSLRRQNGENIDRYYSVPILSTYLGHYDLYSTETYLRLTPEIFPEMLKQIREYSESVIPEVPAL